MSDVYETEIEIPVKLHFTYNPKEPSTDHSPEVPEHVYIEAIEIHGHKLPWEVVKEILAKNLLELEEEILENAEKVGHG